MKVVVAFPDLINDLVPLLTGVETALVEELVSAEVARVTYDKTAGAAYIYARPSRELNIVEKSIIGTRHGRTIELNGAYWSALDIDNFGRIAGIEILAPGDLEPTLSEFAAV